ncbi:MAG: aldo/keto reductase [Thaumarchaeota archaeon]|nr:aldo/keto reductase [Nitrososphaerota archaeon]
MKYRKLGKTGLEVSVVGLGTDQFYGEWGQEFTQSIIDKIIKKANDLGINLIDTAECYGDHFSESLVGNAIEHNREDWIIATKFGHKYNGFQQERTRQFSPKEVIDQLDKSLKALKTDYVDIYQYHSVTNKEFDNEELWAVLEKKVQEGKIRHLGNALEAPAVNNDDMFQLEHAEKAKVEMIQVVYNRINKKAEEKVLPFCQKHNIGAIARIPLARGHLSGKYDLNVTFPSNDRRSFEDKEQTLRQLKFVQELKRTEVPKDMNMAQWALGWCLQNPTIAAVIPGCKNIEQVEINAKAAELNMVK